MTWKILSNWLNANKIFINVGKTEVVLFKSLTKQMILTFTLSKIGSDSIKQIQ